MSDKELPSITREIATKIAILSETSTKQKAWSKLAERLFIIATKDWYIRCLSTLEIERYLEHAKTITDSEIAQIFN